MTDFWRRTAIEAELRRGAMRRNGEYSLREVGYGRVADTAAFECAPCGGSDHGPRRTARLSVQVRTNSPNCETIYDRPSSQLGLGAWMRENPTVVTVEKSSQFQSFLYQLPVLREERPYLPHTTPVAVVLWSRDERLERDRPESEIRWRGDYRLHFIHPNPVAPAGMVTSLWRIFHGR